MKIVSKIRHKFVRKIHSHESPSQENDRMPLGTIFQRSGRDETGQKLSVPNTVVYLVL